MAVNGRLEFIEKEMYVMFVEYKTAWSKPFENGLLIQFWIRSKRIEAQIKDTEEKGDKRRTEVRNSNYIWVMFHILIGVDSVVLCF